MVAQAGGAAHTVDVAGRTVAQGRSLDLSLSARHQLAAQNLVDCMTQHGAQAACERAHVPATTWATRFENAAASQLALVDIGIATGGIRAIASASSPCYRQYWQGAVQGTSDTFKPK